MITKAIKHISAAALLFVFVLSVPVQLDAQKNGKGAVAAPSYGNVNSITARQLKDFLTFIASDELEGRDTPSRGLDTAAKYIAQHLSSWGIKPAGGEGTYFQRFPLRHSKLDPAGTRLEINGQAFNYGEDFLASLNPANFAGSGIVFAGNGWVIKSKNIDPYAGLDIKDKVVVVVNSLPKGVTFQDLKGPAGQDWSSPPLYAQTHGAKAVIAFSTYGSLANWTANRWTQSEKGIVEFGDQQSQIKIPTFTGNTARDQCDLPGRESDGRSLFTKSITGDAMESFELKTEKRASGSFTTKTGNGLHTERRGDP